MSDAAGMALFLCASQKQESYDWQPIRRPAPTARLQRPALGRRPATPTEQFGVDVICRGDNATTNGKVIVLPSLPEPMSDPLERMVVGFLDHEMGHVAFSDFDVAAAFAKRHPGYEGLLNVVEDPASPKLRRGKTRLRKS